MEGVEPVSLNYTGSRSNNRLPLPMFDGTSLSSPIAFVNLLMTEYIMYGHDEILITLQAGGLFATNGAKTRWSEERTKLTQRGTLPEDPRPARGRTWSAEQKAERYTAALIKWLVIMCRLFQIESTYAAVKAKIAQLTLFTHSSSDPVTG